MALCHTAPLTASGKSCLYYYRARYYSPALGRFISEDPIGLRGGLNRYAYVDGGPTNRRDPSGRLGVAGAAVGAGVGLALDVAYQYYHHGWSFDCFSYGEAAAAAGTGALFGSEIGIIAEMGEAANAAREIEVIDGFVDAEGSPF